MEMGDLSLTLKTTNMKKNSMSIVILTGKLFNGLITAEFFRSFFQTFLQIHPKPVNFNPALIYFFNNAFCSTSSMRST